MQFFGRIVRKTMRGGIAQLARALGSYPKGRGFKSNFRYHRPVGQEVKTPPFHGSNTSSILVRVTKKQHSTGVLLLFLHTLKWLGVEAAEAGMRLQANNYFSKFLCYKPNNH